MNLQLISTGNFGAILQFLGMNVLAFGGIFLFLYILATVTEKCEKRKKRKRMQEMKRKRQRKAFLKRVS